MGRIPRTNLIYEVHEYWWYNKPTSFFQLTCALDKQWAFVAYHVAVQPIWISEFGYGHDIANSFGIEKEGKWLELFKNYAQEEGPLGDVGGFDWSYWQLGGVQVGGSGRSHGAEEWYGVLNMCWTGPSNADHFGHLTSLMANPTTTGKAAQSRPSCNNVISDSVSAARVHPMLLLLIPAAARMLIR